MAILKIIQSMDELPDLSPHLIWTVDTETSGVSPYHGHRIVGFSLCAVHDNVADMPYSFYIPLRHQEHLSAFAEAEGHVAVSSEGLQLDPASSRPGVYQNLDPDVVFAWFKQYAADSKFSFVMHNAVFDIGFFKADGVEFACKTIDTMVLAHSIDSGRRRGGYSLDALARTYKISCTFQFYALLQTYLEKNQSYSATEELGSPEQNFALVPPDLLGLYACQDTQVTAELLCVLRKQKLLLHPQKNFNNQSYSQRQMCESDQELVKVLFEMQENGVLMDRAKILEAKADAEQQIEFTRETMVALSGGKEFNPASPKQCEAALVRAGGEVKFWTRPLADQGKQKRQKYTSNKAESSGRSCWNSAALLDYLDIYKADQLSNAHKYITTLRSCRQLQRVVTSYLDAYLKFSDARGVLRGHFDGTGTRTGRLSSWHPNLQNVTKSEGNSESKLWEKATEIQEAHAVSEGRDSFEDDNEDDALDVFVPMGRSREFLQADFYRSGLLLPEHAQDVPEPLAKRIRSFFIARPGNQIVSIDFSSAEYKIAAYLSQDQELIGAFVKNPDLDFHQFCADIAGVSRSEAKSVNFGILYGLGIAALAAMLRLTEYEAKRIRDKIVSAVPAMKQVFLSVKEFGVQHGYIQNKFGRVVKVPEHKAYAALNYEVQGTCGEVMRRAMIRVSKLIKSRAWSNAVLMMLTVHDELVFDIKKELVAEASPIIAACMCECPELAPLPLTCDIEVGDNWGQMLKLKDWLKANPQYAKGAA